MKDLKNLDVEGIEDYEQTLAIKEHFDKNKKKSKKQNRNK
jgi:hypothetical protein